LAITATLPLEAASPAKPSRL